MNTKARRIFRGGAGLRTGWSISIFLIVIAGAGAGVFYLEHIALKQIDPSMFGILTAVGHGTRHAPVSFVLVNEAPLLIAYAIALALMLRIDRETLPAVGLGGTQPLRQLGAGFFWGFAALSLLILMLWSTHHLVFLAHPQSWGHALWHGALWLITCAIIALAEENIFRGYILFRLKSGIGFWPAAIILALLFGLAHGGNPGETHLGEIFAGLYGLIICISIWYTRSLWWAIGYHAAWDWAESYFYGTSDSGMISQGRLLATAPRGNIYLSGGLTGPEGSLFAFVALAASALVMVLTLRTAKSQGAEG